MACGQWCGGICHTACTRPAHILMSPPCLPPRAATPHPNTHTPPPHTHTHPPAVPWSRWETTGAPLPCSRPSTWPSSPSGRQRRWHRALLVTLNRWLPVGAWGLAVTLLARNPWPATHPPTHPPRGVSILLFNPLFHLLGSGALPLRAVAFATWGGLRWACGASACALVRQGAQEGGCRFQRKPCLLCCALHCSEALHLMAPCTPPLAHVLLPAGALSA